MDDIGGWEVMAVGRESGRLVSQKDEDDLC